MDDSGFKATRLSLMIISIGIIIFILGDGSVNETSIFLGSIKLKDTAPVEWAAVLIYMYLLWRYWMYKSHVIGNFGDEFKEYFYSHADYTSIALKEIDNLEDSAFKDNHRTAIELYRFTHLPYSKNIIRPEDNTHIRRYYYPLMLDDHLKPTYLYAPYNDSDKFDKDKIQDIPKTYILNGSDERFEIETLQYQSLELIVLIKMLFSKRSFADFLLPIPIALWAGYLLITL